MRGVGRCSLVGSSVKRHFPASGGKTPFTLSPAKGNIHIMPVCAHNTLTYLVKNINCRDELFIKQRI